MREDIIMLSADGYFFTLCVLHGKEWSYQFIITRSLKGLHINTVTCFLRVIEVGLIESPFF